MDNLNNQFLKFSTKQPSIPVTTKDINAVKEMISDTTNQNISQSVAPKFDKEVVEGSRKLSSWLDEMESVQNKLPQNKPSIDTKDLFNSVLCSGDIDALIAAYQSGVDIQIEDVTDTECQIYIEGNGFTYYFRGGDKAKLENAGLIEKANDEYETIVGGGSFITQAIQEAGIDLNKYKKYFIGVYTNYYRFNPDTIKEDFKARNIQTLADLKQAIDEFGTVVGAGSFTTQAIKNAGIDLKYFIPVYTNYYRFNPDAIRADFHGRVIKTLDDLKAAIDDQINADALFNETDKISASDLVKNIDSLLKSDNPAIVEFAQKLEDLANKYGIDNHYDQEDLFKCVIMLMNKSAGIENSYPVTLSKSTVEELNKKGFFTQLDKIANSEDLKDEYYFGVDGYIDNFRQKDLADCWLLAAISALCSSDAGKDIIKDSIEKITKKDENGNNKEYIRVTFKGIGIHYDISYEEMEEARTLDITYWYNGSSDGDNDVMALELATERLRRDIRSGKILLPYGNETNESDVWAGDNGHGGILKGGKQGDMLFYLTGNTPEMFISTTTTFSNEEVMNFLNDLYEGFKNESLVGYFSLGTDDTKILTTDNEEFCWKKSGYHAFAIVDMSIAEPSDPKKNTVTIANPWYPDEPYTFTWEEFSNIKMYQMGIVSTELHEHNYVKNYNKTEFVNTIDYNAKVSVNGQDYTINDILESQEALLYETKDSVDTDGLIYDILSELLSDIQPEIRNKIIKVFWNIYEHLAHRFDLSNPNDSICIGSDYKFSLYSYMANDYGVSNGENGTIIDVKRIIQKAVELCETYTREPLSLEAYEEKLQNGDFDTQVGELELTSYLEEYKELLINDMSSKYEYNEGFIQLINLTLSAYARNEKPERDENGKFNLQEALNRVKNKFEQYTNPPEENITSYNIEVSWNMGDSMKTYINDIVRDAYDSNKNKIHAKNLADFKQKLIEYIVQKYGMEDELKQNGVIKLSNIPDINGDGNWVDEFYQIVQDFAHKDDDELINYYKEFELNGKKCNLNDILSSKDAGSINITNREDLLRIIDNMVYSISEVLQNIDETVVKNIKSTLFEYYYKFADLSWDRETYYSGKEIEINNYITGEKENIFFNLKKTFEYGINGGNGYYVEIDIKTFAQKFLELVEQATGSV